MWWDLSREVRPDGGVRVLYVCILCLYCVYIIYDIHNVYYAFLFYILFISTDMVCISVCNIMCV